MTYGPSTMVKFTYYLYIRIFSFYAYYKLVYIILLFLFVVLEFRVVDQGHCFFLYVSHWLHSDSNMFYRSVDQSRWRFFPSHHGSVSRVKFFVYLLLCRISYSVVGLVNCLHISSHLNIQMYFSFDACIFNIFVFVFVIYFKTLSAFPFPRTLPWLEHHRGEIVLFWSEFYTPTRWKNRSP